MFQRMNPHKVAPELQKPMFALTKRIGENIDPVLFELVKLRASILNGCGHCIDIHSTDALKAGETPPPSLFGLSAWWEVPLYSAKERAALALTDRGHPVRGAWCPRRCVRRGSCRVRRAGAHLPGRVDRAHQHVEPFRGDLPADAAQRCGTRSLGGWVGRGDARSGCTAETTASAAGLAYRLIGSRVEAEDVVQEALLRVHRAGVDDIESPAAYLTTVTTRLAIDHLRSARVRRESYVGPWLPEPIADDPAPDAASQAVLDDFPLDGVPRRPRGVESGRASGAGPA